MKSNNEQNTIDVIEYHRNQDWLKAKDSSAFLNGTIDFLADEGLERNKVTKIFELIFKFGHAYGQKRSRR